MANEISYMYGNSLVVLPDHQELELFALPSSSPKQACENMQAMHTGTGYLILFCQSILQCGNDSNCVSTLIIPSLHVYEY